MAFRCQPKFPKPDQHYIHTHTPGKGVGAKPYFTTKTLRGKELEQIGLERSEDKENIPEWPNFCPRLGMKQPKSPPKRAIP